MIDDELDFINSGFNDLVEYSSSHDNLIITPHIGGASYESVQKTDIYVINKFANQIK